MTGSHLILSRVIKSKTLTCNLTCVYIIWDALFDPMGLHHPISLQPYMILTLRKFCLTSEVEKIK
jgi:hypothetical protein